MVCKQIAADVAVQHGKRDTSLSETGSPARCHVWHRAFLLDIEESRQGCGVMDARQILVLEVKVRILSAFLSFHNKQECVIA